MGTRSDYSSDKVEAALLIAVEAMELLKDYHEDTVLIGGFVPYLLGRLNPGSEMHSGTLDVDIALSNLRLSTSHKEIDKTLCDHGYYKKDIKAPLVYCKEVKLASGQTIEVQLDLMLAEIRAGIHTQSDRGYDLVLSNPLQITTNIMIDGIEQPVNIRVANIVSMLVMKANALNSRHKHHKDAYDIYHLCKSYPYGLDRIIEELRPHISRLLVKDALEILREWFLDFNAWGPKAVAEFYEFDSKEEEAIKRRDAFGQLDYVLKVLGF